MKKFIMTFLVAGLMITSVLSLSSCKKTDTNANKEEWVPVVYEMINPGDSQNLRTEPVTCYYCGVVIEECNDELEWKNEAFYCPTHSHIECFEATDNCYSPTQISCRYRGVKHYHIMTNHGWYWHGTHVGGGACPQ